MQSQIIATGDPETSTTLQEIIRDIVDQGVLRGCELVTVGPVILGVNPGVALTDSGVLIVETELKQLLFTQTVSPQNYTVAYQYTPSKNFGGNPATLALQPGLIEAVGFVNGVVLG